MLASSLEREYVQVALSWRSSLAIGLGVRVQDKNNVNNSNCVDYRKSRLGLHPSFKDLL